MQKRLVALPSRQAAEHRRGGGREMVSISRVEGRMGSAARTPGVATNREVRAREPQPRTLQRGLAPPPATADGGVDGHRRARGGRPRLTPVSLSSRVDGVMEQRVQRGCSTADFKRRLDFDQQATQIALAVHMYPS